MNFVILDGATLQADGNSWEGLHRLGPVAYFDRSSPAEVVERLRDATVAVTNKARVTREAIEKAAHLRLIAVSATGYDCVDLAAARTAGVTVCHVPEYGTDSVAQFTIALLLELSHHVGLHGAQVRAGEWARSPEFCFWRTSQIELVGKTLGIVGLGRIGRRVGAIAHALGMQVVASGRNQSTPLMSGPFEWSDLDTLFATADVVSLHCPLTSATAGLVNRDRLRLMKPTAWLLNTSRGGLVDEAALAEALNNGWIAAAAVDVLSREPPPSDNPLLTARNCLITPHIAWASREARGRLLQSTIDNIDAFLAGAPMNVIR